MMGICEQRESVEGKVQNDRGPSAALGSIRDIYGCFPSRI